MKIVVVGGGASGLVCSIFSKNSNNDVLVLEKNSKPMKKLLITGNGKCNYFNDDFSFEHYYSSDVNLLKDVITGENKAKILDFLNSIGVVSRIRNGYYYPNSNQAYSVYNSLMKEASIRGVNFLYDTTVLNIVKKNDQFIINTNNGDYVCDKVVISTGGKSYPKTGSTGDGYLFGKSFGHSINTVYPGLVQLVSDNKFLKDLSGVRADACVSLYCDGVIKSEVGEVQFTDYGLSGICIFNLSNYIGKMLNKKVSVKINFFNEFNINDSSSMYDLISSMNRVVRGRTVSELLEGYLNYKIVNVILKKCNIDLDNSWDSLGESRKSNLCESLISFEFNIVDLKGFDSAQVSVGGISLEEVNINSFESKIVPGLYFIGEVLDVSGDCGGYNLGFAFLSGMLSGIDLGGYND